MKRKLFLLLCALLTMIGVQAETDYTNLMPSTWTNQTGGFQGGSERYQKANYNSGKVIYQSFEAPADGIYEIKFYAVTSSTSGRGFDNKWGPNIAQAYASAGSNKAVVAMEVINQTGCTLVEPGNIRTLSVEAAKGETIEYGLENIAEGGNWYTILKYSAKMKTVAEIFQAQYDEAYAIWEHSTENEVGARATFKTYVDALNTAMSGTLADAQTASDNLAAQLVIYESKSYPVKGSGVKYDFTSKMDMAVNAWTCKQGNGPAQYGFTGATETYKGSAYAVGEVMYQTISGLANGEYEIHFYAVANSPRSESVSGPNIAYVYANDQTTDIDVIAQDGCTPSEYERTITVMVSDGTIKYGISNKAAGGNWYVAKNVALYMTGAPDLSDYYEAIAGKLITANGLKSSPMNSAVLTDLQNAIDATEGYTDITVIGTLETMNDNLTTAINNANTSISNYEEALSVLNAASNLDAAGQTIYANNETVSAIQSAYDNRSLVAVTDEQETACNAALAAVEAWLEIKDYADALVAVENTNAEANAKLASAISTQNTAATSATTTATVTTATSTLKTAMITYAGAANPTSGNRFDLTFMLTNPDLTDFASWTSYEDVDGWYSDQPDGNRQTMHNDGAAGPHGDAFFEYWSETPKANGEFALYMKPTLPVGTYTINCDAFADQPTGGDNCAVYFYANDTQGSLVNNYPMAEKEISFINDEEQEVKIGLKPLTGNTYRWMGIGYVKLYKEYTDNTTYNITTNISNADVAVTVDGDPATSAKALKTVTLTVSNFTEGYAIGNVTATYNDGEVKYLDVANPSVNVYTYQQPAYDVTVTINVVVDKSALNTAIANATAARKSDNEGTNVFQIPVAAGTTLATAISTAQSVYNDADATVSDVASAVTAINGAKETYEATTLNAPIDGVQYRLKNVSGATWANKYYRLYPNADQPNGGYSVSCDNDAKAYLAQAWKFTAASGTNCYTLSMTDADGKTRYLCTNKKGYDQGSATQIRTTTEAGKALVVKVIATNTANVWNLQNTEDNSYIGGQDAGMYSNSQNYSMLIEAGEKAAPKATIVDGSNWATFMSPFAVSLNDLEGVDAAYTAENNDGAIRTVAVEDNTIPANTPVLLYRESKSGKFEKELSGWGTAAQSTYTVGLLTGSYELADIPYHAETAKNNYVLQMQGDVVAFYNVTKTGLKVGAYRAYLTMPEESEARAVLFFPENPTGINAVKAADAETEGSLKDGKYLIGNKIVLVKNGVKYDANGKKLN